MIFFMCSIVRRTNIYSEEWAVPVLLKCWFHRKPASNIDNDNNDNHNNDDKICHVAV